MGDTSILDPMETTVLPVPLEPEVWVPIALERCDAGCGAQALVQVTLLTGDLVFCRHDYTKNKARLEPVTVTVLFAEVPR